MAACTDCALEEGGDREDWNTKKLWRRIVGEFVVNLVEDPMTEI